MPAVAFLFRPFGQRLFWPWVFAFTLLAILSCGQCMAAAFSVSNQASCNALPLTGGSPQWSGSRCTIPPGATFNLLAGDTLAVSSGVTLKVGGTLRSSGSITNFGRILVPLDPKGRMILNSGGRLLNKRGAKILSNGEISVQGGASLINSGFIHHQFAGSFNMAGAFTGDSGVMSLSVNNLYNFTGTLDLIGTNYHDITLNGVVLVRIAPTSTAGNTWQLVVCDYDKNLNGETDVPSTRIAPGEVSLPCTANRPASLAGVPRVILVDDDDDPVTTIPVTNMQVTSTQIIDTLISAIKNSRSISSSGADRYLGGTG